MEVVVYDVSQCIHPEAICCQIGRGGDCIDAIRYCDISGDQESSGNEDEIDETDLSLTLTAQNPSRIDVMTLRKKKVNRKNRKNCQK